VTAVLIVNPQASKVSDDLVEAVLARLPAGVEVLRTAGPGEATELARRAEQGADVIYVLSGDGTYNEVLNGVEGRVPLAFLPGGGTSVLPRALGVPRDPVRAAEALARGRARRVSLGRVDGRRFGFNAGVGIDAELVRAVDELGRREDGRRPGDAAFAAAALRLLLRRRGRLPEGLEIEGHGRAAFAAVANCTPYTYLGRVGLRVTPGATFEGGLDLLAPSGVTPASLPRLAWHAWRGGAPRGAVTLHDVDRIEVRCDVPMPVQCDGEDLGDAERVVFESERDALAVVVPAEGLRPA
jgi:diacylglycerol kinase family enzyme